MKEEVCFLDVWWWHTQRSDWGVITLVTLLSLFFVCFELFWTHSKNRNLNPLLSPECVLNTTHSLDIFTLERSFCISHISFVSFLNDVHLNEVNLFWKCFTYSYLFFGMGRGFLKKAAIFLQLEQTSKKNIYGYIYYNSVLCCATPPVSFSGGLSLHDIKFVMTSNLFASPPDSPV